MKRIRILLVEDNQGVRREFRKLLKIEPDLEVVGEAKNGFVENGLLEIDTNLIENSIRPSALGKRNWMFIGHPEAGERSAVIYT